MEQMVCWVLRLLLLASTGSVLGHEDNFTAECGLRPLVAPVTSKVAGPQKAQLGAWPWHVSMQYSNGLQEYKHLCGASLIRCRWLLSAAHCYTEKRNPNQWRAVFGFINMPNPGYTSNISLIKSIVIHQYYDKDSRDNNIALLHLQSDIKYNDYIRPLCLATPNLYVDMDSRCYITGWNTPICEGPPADALQEVQLDIVSYQTCNETGSYVGQITKNMICAGFRSRGNEICEGDDGGPFMCYFPLQQKYFQVGLLSATYTCGKTYQGKTTFYNLYTLVKSYQNWIDWQIVSSTNKPTLAGEDLNLQSYIRIFVATVFLSFLF